jgi:hypothetical protein
VVIWYIISRFGILYQEKSGNTDDNLRPHEKMLRAATQGDQIGRIFAYWAIVYFGQFFPKITE